MAPKLPLSISHSCTSALYHALMTAASPSSRPPLRSITNVRRLHDITAKKNSSTAMGRSGYDTTNMKTAARPRPASKGSGAGQGDGKTTKAKQAAPASQQQQQKQGQQGGDGSQSTGTTVSGQGSEKRFGKFKGWREDHTTRCRGVASH